MTIRGAAVGKMPLDICFGMPGGDGGCSHPASNLGFVFISSESRGLSKKILALSKVCLVLYYQQGFIE